MGKQLDDPEESALQALQRRYALFAAWLARGNRAPEPARSPEPAGRQYRAQDRHIVKEARAVPALSAQKKIPTRWPGSCPRSPLLLVPIMTTEPGSRKLRNAGIGLFSGRKRSIIHS
jgi:hypothetical protein